MSQQGAALQSFNQELVKCLEDLKIKRKNLYQIVQQEEQEKISIVKKIEELQEKLMQINKNLEKHKVLSDNYEKTIKDTESGFKKILESSQMLLNFTQQEANKLGTAPKGKPEAVNN